MSASIVSDDRVVKFVSDLTGKAFCPPYTAMGIERDGKIVGGVLFNVFEGSDIHVSVAGSGWTRDFLRAVGDYVFGLLGCERMTAITSNELTATFVERLGGKHEGVLRNHFGPGIDGIVGGILRDEWLFAK